MKLKRRREGVGGAAARRQAAEGGGAGERRLRRDRGVFRESRRDDGERQKRERVKSESRFEEAAGCEADIGRGGLTRT